MLLICKNDKIRFTWLIKQEVTEVLEVLARHKRILINFNIIFLSAQLMYINCTHLIISSDLFAFNTSMILFIKDKLTSGVQFNFTCRQKMYSKKILNLLWCVYLCVCVWINDISWCFCYLHFFRTFATAIC